MMADPVDLDAMTASINGRLKSQCSAMVGAAVETWLRVWIRVADKNCGREFAMSAIAGAMRAELGEPTPDDRAAFDSGVEPAIGRVQ
jgi:hypothetical protein